MAWPDIAYACGFADQSHMIREFKAIAGQLPEDFFRANKGEATAQTEPANFIVHVRAPLAGKAGVTARPNTEDSLKAGASGRRP
jgi:hypothetical protein